MGSGGSSLRQLVASLLGLPIVLAITGCVAIPTSTEGGFDKKEELIKALIGTSITDVRSQLGEPRNTYELPDVTYLLYERRGEQGWFSLAHPLAMIWYQFPVGWGTTNLVQCLLIESRDDKVVHAEIKSDSNLTGAAMHLSPTYKSCPSLVWEVKELERIELAAKNNTQVITLTAQAEKGDLGAAKILAYEFRDLRYLRKLAAAGNLKAAATLAESFSEKKPLYDLAEKGSVDAAVELAEGHGDHKPLKTLADSGNRQATAEFKRVSCQQIYYRADDSVKPQASDKFVYVCEGDDYLNEETVLIPTDWNQTLISTDWNQTYSSIPPRRYFQTVPKGLR